MEAITAPIKAIIGLGNPGPGYYYHRHSIGFRIIDALAQRHGGSWQSKDHMEIAEIMLGDNKVLLVKPQTYMNASGKVIPYLLKKGIKPENVLVIHDELEKPFGKLSFRVGGSHRGHNGLKSIIAACGNEFARLRVGIGRPEDKANVSDYVLSKFAEAPAEVLDIIEAAVDMLEDLF